MQYDGFTFMGNGLICYNDKLYPVNTFAIDHMETLSLFLPCTPYTPYHLPTLTPVIPIHPTPINSPMSFFYTHNQEGVNQLPFQCGHICKGKVIAIFTYVMHKGFPSNQVVQRPFCILQFCVQNLYHVQNLRFPGDCSLYSYKCKKQLYIRLEASTEMIYNFLFRRVHKSRILLRA